MHAGHIDTLLVCILPLFSTVQMMSVLVTCSMRTIRPSSSMMVLPGCTSRGDPCK